jgi:RNA recognition motif-containing protein
MSVVKSCYISFVVCQMDTQGSPNKRLKTRSILEEDGDVVPMESEGTHSDLTPITLPKSFLDNMRKAKERKKLLEENDLPGFTMQDKEVDGWWDEDDADQSERSVHLLAVPSNVKWPDIEKAFSSFGELDDCGFLKTDAKMAVIIFKDKESVAKALEYKGSLGQIHRTNTINFAPGKALKLLVTNVQDGITEMDILNALPLTEVQKSLVSFSRTKNISQKLGTLSTYDWDVYRALLAVDKIACNGCELGLKKSIYSQDPTEVVRLWLGWLPSNANSRKLYNLCKNMGLNVVSVSVPRDKETNESKGYAFVTFPTYEDAAKAFWTVKYLKGKKISFDEVRSKQQNGQHSQ